MPGQPRLGLDAGYDYRPVHEGLAERGVDARITPRGEKVSIRTGERWVVERTNSWLNNFGKLRRCTERRKTAIEFYNGLACVFVTVRHLIRRAWTHYRWDTRPRTSRIRPTGGRSKRIIFCRRRLLARLQG